MGLNQTTPKLLQFATAGSKWVAKRFNFTQKTLNALTTTKQVDYFYDGGVRGLAIAVTSKGLKTFLLYRKIQGRPERIPIGRYPDLSIEQARGKAQELNTAIAKGENPRADQRAMRQEKTFGEFFELFIEDRKSRKKRTWPQQVAMFNRHLAHWRHRKLSAIRTMDVANLHTQLGRTSGDYAANRVLELVSAIFNQAIKWKWKGAANPARAITAFREYKRERFLQPAEFPAFFAALMEEQNETIRDYVLLSLFTGARAGCVMAMRWDELDLGQAQWHIPITKHGGSETVTLSPEALAVLERRKATAAMREFVSPGVGKSGHLVQPRHAWGEILKRAGLRDLRLHDLRRTLGSWQAAGGSSLPIIGKSLGHKSLAATQVYARLNLDPVRESVNKATRAMMLAAKAEPALLEGMK
jgi:integrase